LLATLTSHEEGGDFLWVAFIGCFLGGLGSGINSVQTNAILHQFNHDDREKYIEWTEIANGLGLMLTPTIAGLLFRIGGFPYPFFTFGKLFC